MTCSNTFEGNSVLFSKWRSIVLMFSALIELNINENMCRLRWCYEMLQKSNMEEKTESGELSLL